MHFISLKIVGGRDSVRCPSPRDLITRHTPPFEEAAWRKRRLLHCPERRKGGWKWEGRGKDGMEEALGRDRNRYPVCFQSLPAKRIASLRRHNVIYAAVAARSKPL
jgi:hypothetical protein